MSWKRSRGIQDRRFPVHRNRCGRGRDAEGDVQVDAEKTAIEQVVRHRKGLCDLNNRIEIKARETTDEVNTSVASALKRSPRLRVKDINVETESRIVTLTGDLRSLAEATPPSAWHGPVVEFSEVENRLTVTP